MSEGPSVRVSWPSGPPAGGPDVVSVVATDGPYPIWICDQAGACVYVNDAWLAFTGRRREDALGDGWTASLHPEDCGSVVRSLVESLRTRGASKTDYRIRRHDGDYRWVIQTQVPLTLSNGTVAGVLATCVDVTAHRRAAQVAESRLRLNQLAVHESVDGVIQHALDETEALTSSEIAFFHFLEPDQRTITLQMWSTNTVAHMCSAEGKGAHYALDEAGVWADCVRLRRATIHNDYASLPNRRGLPDGHARVRSEVVVPVMRGGQVVAIMGVGNANRPYGDEDVEVVRSMADLAYDAADRRRTMDALERSMERLRLALEATSDGLWDWEPQANRLWWSPRVYEMLQHDPGDVPLTAQWVESLIDPDDLARVHDAFRRHMSEGHGSLAVEARWMTGRREWRWIFTRGQAVARDDKGVPVRVIGTHQDITDRKRDEERRLQMERRLQQTQKLESLGVLAGGIAHDFNNLLTVMLGNIELALLDVSDREHATGNLQDAIGATQRASELTRQLLAYAGQARYLVEEVDLNNLLTDNIRLFRTAAVEERRVLPAVGQRGAPRQGRCRPVAAGRHEPGHERVRGVGPHPRDGHRVHRRHGVRRLVLRAGRRRRQRPPGHLCLVRGPRHWARHGRGHARADVGPVLLDEVPRPRPRHASRPRHRPLAQGRPGRRQQAGIGNTHPRGAARGAARRGPRHDGRWSGQDRGPARCRAGRR